MIIDGKKIANQIQEEIKQSVFSLQKSRPPCLAVILVGNHPASEVYINHKTLACKSVGMTSIQQKFSQDISENALISAINTLNQDETVDGILVQLPLPLHINPHRILLQISPEKDVDGFHPLNMGKLLIGQSDGFISCTPLGIKVLLERSKISTQGKHVVIIGRSNIVGKPLAALMVQNSPDANATVTIAHSATRHLSSICQRADILVAAMGNPLFIKAEMIQEGAVVIDVGTNKVPDVSMPSGFRLVGDVDFESVKNKCSAITPVPKGVGPMTIAMLLKNTLLSYQRKFSCE